MPRDRWSNVENALRRIGVSDARVWQVRSARERLTEMDSLGMPLMPDFTLHNHNHSDNIIFLLAQLQDRLGFTLSEYEAYLLATAAYLHDLGMFFSGERFKRKILANSARTLRACPQDQCDCLDNYPLEGKAVGAQIRETHNLLSAFMLRTDSTIRGSYADDLAYLITICRGHRKADLRERRCTCFQNKPLAGGVVRLGLLAALLRLADGLDFYRDRAPKYVFKQRALDFLRNPTALEHWIKHYFVTDPYITRQDDGGNIYLVCTINFTVPIRRINGRAYRDFFRPLFERHISRLNDGDLDIDRYPLVFAEALHITGMKAVLAQDEADGFRDLPKDVIRFIEQSECEDALAFLQWLQVGDASEEELRAPTRPILVNDGQNHGHRKDTDSMVMGPSSSRDVSSPLFDNPFFHRGAIRDQDYFFGRKRETRAILRAIKRGACVSIIGPWHIGKTSLLFHVKDAGVLRMYGLAPDELVIIYCTGQELRGDDQSNLCCYLLKSLQQDAVLQRPLGTVDDLDRSKLLGLLANRLNIGEIKTLCFAVQGSVKDLSYDALPGEGLEGKARELIAFLERREQLGLLLVKLFEQRPDLATNKSSLSVSVGRNAGKAFSELSVDDAYQSLEELVEGLTRRDLRVVLLLDEFELFAVNSGTPESFFYKLKSLQEKYALTLVTSSRISLQQLSRHRDSSLPSAFSLMFQSIELGLFGERDTKSLIGLSQRAGITFSKRTIKFILEMAGLHPFFLQVVCDHVFERRSAGVELDDADYDILRREIRRELKGHFIYYWGVLDPRQQFVLASLETLRVDPDYAPCLEGLARQGLIVEQGGSYEYVSISFKDFVKGRKKKLPSSRKGDSLVDRELGSVCIVEEIGSGGMATVYKGHQAKLARDVAVKVLPRDVQREDFLPRFQREAQAIAKLRHPNIVAVHDFGQEEDLAYIIMDLVPGRTLADLIRDGLTLPKAIEIVIQIGDALHCAHRKGIVHRDVKPANILIDGDGRPLLTDFGLAKFLRTSEQLTKHGGLMGTIVYVAPEQAQGAEVDARSDLYALGTVLYEMVTGQPPFEASIALRKLQESPPSPKRISPSLPVALEQVILKAIARSPDDRYQDALEMIQDLRSVQSLVGGFADLVEEDSDDECPA